MTAVSIDGHVNLRKLVLHLIKLIADVGHGRIVGGQHVTRRLSLVSSAEHCHLMRLRQEADEVLGVRRFAPATHGDVAHADDG